MRIVIVKRTHCQLQNLRGGSALKEQAQFITELERAGKLDRGLEFIPSDEEIAERLALGKGLTRPELSVLLSIQ